MEAGNEEFQRNPNLGSCFHLFTRASVVSLFMQTAVIVTIVRRLFNHDHLSVFLPHHRTSQICTWFQSLVSVFKLETELEIMQSLSWSEHPRRRPSIHRTCSCSSSYPYFSTQLWPYQPLLVPTIHTGKFPIPSSIDKEVI